VYSFFVFGIYFHRMSRNGDSQDLIPEPTATTKLTWQWQKKASLRNIENNMSEIKEKLSSIHSEVECHRKEDKREIKLLTDDLAMSRSKNNRLEKTIEEMKKEKLHILKVNEELLQKKEAEIRSNLKQYEEALLKKDQDLKAAKKEAETAMLKRREEHEKELKARDNHLAALEAQHTQKIASLIGDKEKLQNEYEHRLREKQMEMDNLRSKDQAEAEELQQSKELAVNELNEKIEESNLKLSDAILYLRNAHHIIEVKNAFIAKQRQAFEKIIEHVGESDPKPAKLKGNLWKLAHYIRTGGQAAWKGYINRAQWEAVNEEADAINRISNRALADYKFETEDEPQFRAALQELFTQLEQSS
jgi:chromosome segregation ATPase